MNKYIIYILQKYRGLGQKGSHIRGLDDLGGSKGFGSVPPGSVLGRSWCPVLQILSAFLREMMWMLKHAHGRDTSRLLHNSGVEKLAVAWDKNSTAHHHKQYPGKNRQTRSLTPEGPH